MMNSKLELNKTLQEYREKFLETEQVRWRIFINFQDDVHIIPVDIDGNNFENHLTSPMCSCSPVLKRYEEGDVRFMFTHNLKKIGV